MDNNIQKGQLRRWSDDKGFGFIKPDNDSNDVFLHISALKGMSRRPTVGDTIFYNIQLDTNGKNRAFNARIDGVTQALAQAHPASPRRNIKKSNNSNWFIKLLVFIVFVVFTFYLFEQKTAIQTAAIKTFPTSASKIPQPIYSSYRCNGKTYCSEMASCEEAKFYQNSCPGTKMDGDGDGVPCESQWCN